MIKSRFSGNSIQQKINWNLVHIIFLTKLTHESGKKTCKMASLITIQFNVFCFFLNLVSAWGRQQQNGKKKHSMFNLMKMATKISVCMMPQ